ncbi:CBS domain-containing protein [Archangium sp.]|uniref:CBS domain-containing protein n=1 Tax=Archangium sp. TaxID=1872627 RepID=UPI00286CE63A|nr:CBS domain-containing protein [Archangium sp.]
MRQNPTLVETLSSTEVALLPTDTLLRALRMMEKHQVQLLPVMEQAGGLLGLVTREHLLSAWRVDPFLPVAAVMAAHKLVV